VADTLTVGSGKREEVVMAAKKAAAVEGIGAVVLAVAKVAMELADKNSGNGGAGNGGRNRGSDGATTINQNGAAVGGGSSGGGGGGGGGGGSGGSKTAEADHSCDRHGHILIYSII
jgi:hypothetical protein